MAEVSGFLLQKEISKAQEEIKKGEQLLRERQKHILLADKSEYGWATVHEDKSMNLPIIRTTKSGFSNLKSWRKHSVNTISLNCLQTVSASLVVLQMRLLKSYNPDRSQHSRICLDAPLDHETVIPVVRWGIGATSVLGVPSND